MNSPSALLTLASIMISSAPAPAQTFTTLYSFTGGSDGSRPNGSGLILGSDTLYGTTRLGGTSGRGVVFAINTDGTGFTNLHSFPAVVSGTNSDGANPYCRLALMGNTLFGTTRSAGASGEGTVFQVNADSTGFKVLYSFTARVGSTNNDGAAPYAGLVVSGNTLYGAGNIGGSSGGGTVFAIKTNGTGFTNLHSFVADEGLGPRGDLILSGDTLYGTTYGGGSSSVGTVFAVNTNGSGFTNLYNFGGSSGASPIAGLIVSGNTLYGTAYISGSSGNGTVFKLNKDGTGFTVLHSFSALASGINSDGATPEGSLVLSGNTLYGTTYNGGASGRGTVFAVNTDGAGFTNLYSFSALSGGINSDGANPYGALILSGDTLYGTAVNGGTWGYGTVFRLSLPVRAPKLMIIASGTNVVLKWLTNATGFILESTTNAIPLAGWSTVSPAPVVVNGQYTVTNPISGTQQFYRLSR